MTHGICLADLLLLECGGHASMISLADEDYWSVVVITSESFEQPITTIGVWCS